MLAILSEPDVRRLTGSVHSTQAAHAPMEEAERTRTTAWYSTRNDQPDRLDLAIVCLETGAVVGEVVLNDYDPDNQACNFRILIGAAGQNRGLGTQATQLLLAYARDHLPLHRIELSVYSFNPRARHVYEAAGFRCEGTRRDAFCFDGQWFDEEIFAILHETL